MASQGKTVGIVAWSLVGILAIGLVVAALMGGQQAGRAAGLGEALVQVAQTAGVEEWTPAVPVPEAGAEVVPEAQALTASLLKDAKVLAGVQARIQEAIRSAQAELTTAKDGLATARTEASNAQSQVGSLSQQVQEQATQADSLSKELAARSEALAAAQADLVKAAEDAEAASEAAEKQKARLEKTVERLKAEKAAEVARLQAEIEAMNASMELEEGWTGEISEEAGEELEPEIDLEAGRVIGVSEMFSHIHYGEDQTLRLQLLDGQTLTYDNVTPDAVERLAAAASKLDVTYRFRIQGKFKSTPPDSVVIRKYWKWQRRHKARSEVRFIEPEALVAEIVVPEEPAGEEPAAE